MPMLLEILCSYENQSKLHSTLPQLLLMSFLLRLPYFTMSPSSVLLLLAATAATALAGGSSWSSGMAGVALNSTELEIYSVANSQGGWYDKTPKKNRPRINRLRL